MTEKEENRILREQVPGRAAVQRRAATTPGGSRPGTRPTPAARRHQLADARHDLAVVSTAPRSAGASRPSSQTTEFGIQFGLTSGIADLPGISAALIASFKDRRRIPLRSPNKRRL